MMQTKVCLVIPTYNEAENIRKLFQLLFSPDAMARYQSENISLHVLVVDDNSPDGTSSVVMEEQVRNPYVNLLLRKEKNGLGAAYVAGLQHALKTIKPDILFEMDADLSHDPKYIIPMVNKIRAGNDFVIGSRYVKGGSIPADWGLWRKFISKSANMYAKSMLGIRHVHDCTGGYRAIRASTLKDVDFGNVVTKGYAFQLSLLDQMRFNGARIAEIPIAFRDRTKGDSKMRVADMMEVGTYVLTSRFKPARPHIRKEVAPIPPQSTTSSSGNFVSWPVGFFELDAEVVAIKLCINGTECVQMATREVALVEMPEVAEIKA